MASATVSFSRFLPEVELVYALLNSGMNESEEAQENANDYPGCVFFLNAQFSECIIAEALLKQKHTHDEIMSLDDFKEYDDYPASDYCVYSDKPTQFKITVRKHAKRINWVFIETDSGIKVYDDIQQFLDEFDPDDFHQNAAQSIMLDDEEM